MYIKIQCRAYIRMTEYRADCLVVTPRLDAARGEAVTQAMELHRWNAQAVKYSLLVVAVRPWLAGLFRA